MEQPNEYRQRVVDNLNRNVLEQEIKDLDRTFLSKMDDKDLALWQSKFNQHSPQFRIAEYEWQRRLIAEQIKASRFAAYTGLLGTVVGAVITWLSAK